VDIWLQVKVRESGLGSRPRLYTRSVCDTTATLQLRLLGVALYKCYDAFIPINRQQQPILTNIRPLPPHHSPAIEPTRADNSRAFPVSGASRWNDLPLHVASAPSLTVFRQRLKTFLFSRSYQDTRLVCYY